MSAPHAVALNEDLKMSMSTGDIIQSYKADLSYIGDQVVAIHDVLEAIGHHTICSETGKWNHDFDLITHVATSFLAAIFEFENPMPKAEDVGQYLIYVRSAIKESLVHLSEQTKKTGFRLFDLVDYVEGPDPQPKFWYRLEGAAPRSSGCIFHTSLGYIPAGEEDSITCHGRTYVGGETITAIHRTFLATAGVLTVDIHDPFWHPEFASWVIFVMLAAMIEYDPKLVKADSINDHISKFCTRLGFAIAEQRRLTEENGIQLFRFIGFDS